MPSTVIVDRRAFVQGVVRGGLALALLPGTASAAWQSVAARDASAPAGVLGAAHRSLIGAVADTILPRSDTPGAIDVGVVAWIDAVAAGYFTDVQRAGFLSGLAALDDYSTSIGGVRLAQLRPSALDQVISSLDAACGSKELNPAECAYVQLKELIVHGYFTSEPVQRDILQFSIIPGRFDPSVKITSPSGK